MRTQVLWRYDAYKGDGYYARTLPNGPWMGPFKEQKSAEAYAQALSR